MDLQNKNPFANQIAQTLKSLLKDVLPPFITRLLKPTATYGYFGNYNSWDQAAALCKGYNESSIFQKVSEAALSVKRGEASYERDSMLFHDEEVNAPVLSCLLHAAACQQGNLEVTDFGGSLGSTYFQHQRFFNELPLCRWVIIEQQPFVEFGKAKLEDESLAFARDFNEASQKVRPRILLLSSVWQYLPDTEWLMKKIESAEFEYLIFDRTGFTKANTEIITIQKVNPEIYEGSYPARFINEGSFLERISNGYRLHSSFVNDEFSNRRELYFKGFYFIRKNK